VPKLSNSKPELGAGAVKKRGVKKVHDARSEVHGRGETYTSEDELKVATLAVCRHEML
jgi:hypothetical protein